MHKNKPKDKNYMIISLDTEQVINKIQQTFMIRDIREIVDILKHIKGILQQTHSQHQIKCSMQSTEIRNKTRLSTLFIAI